MKKVKIGLLLIVLAFIAVFIYQNQEYFLSQPSFNLNLKFVSYSFPGVYNAVLALGFFVAGFLIAYISSLAVRFKARKEIRNLNCTVDSHMQKISFLQSELDSYKVRASSFNATPDGAQNAG
jgi:uncharacterized integral membrane protein